MCREALVMDKLKEFLDYDPTSPSCLRWKVSRGRVKKGSVAGNIKGNGYYQLGLDGKYYPCHRVIWVILGKEIPEGFVVDHIDNNTLNNSIDNLRISTVQGNTHNRSKRPNMTSKYKGVCWNKAAKKWKVGITFNYKQIHLGYFKSEEAAKLAYDRKSEELFGDFKWREDGQV